MMRCDNEAVVTVLHSGKMCDSFLAAENIWYNSTIHDIDAQFDILGMLSGEPLFYLCCHKLFSPFIFSEGRGLYSHLTHTC